MPDIDQELELKANFFKALGHPMRLLLVSLIALKPRHGEELAAIIGLDPATISHHLAKLTEAGLLIAYKDQYYQTYSLVKDSLNPSLKSRVLLSPTSLARWVQGDAYTEQVYQAFFIEGRLKRIPTQLKKRQIVMERIAESFNIGQIYLEAELNEILLNFHPDITSLRKDLLYFGLMHRKDGQYRRVPDDN
ncbi:hypothetical protein MASR2M15_18250 [Anaerolineales bacterium]